MKIWSGKLTNLVWNKHKQKNDGMNKCSDAVHTTMVFFVIGLLLLVCCNWLVVISFLSLVIIIGLSSLVCCYWFVVVCVLLLVHCCWFVIDSLSLLVHYCVVYCCPWCGCAIWFLHMLVLGCLSSAIVVQSILFNSVVSVWFVLLYWHWYWCVLWFLFCIVIHCCLL